MKEQKQPGNVGSGAVPASRNIGPASLADILGCDPGKIPERDEQCRQQRRKIYDGIREGGSAALACMTVIAGASVTYSALHR